jgi:glycosyltransferase involved in cell wall biosynthesis
MNRLAGAAALVADPEDASDFAAKVFQIISEPSEAQKSRKEDSLRHSRNFDSQAYLEQILLMYNEITKKK